MRVQKSTKADSAFNDHKRKAVIRRDWCKPQLEQLTSILKSKLVYLGLPDVEALDIKEWIDYLDKVIAFQCSNYNGKDINVAKLDEFLKKLERQSKIRSGFVYQGWMEDIVMGGISERGDMYSQNDFLRIYNLDFCNNLKTPRTVYDSKGRPIKIIYKTEVINKLLEHQKTSTTNNHRNFIMYLTVNTDTFRDDGVTIKDTVIKAYLKKVAKITKPEVKAAREMKAYCFDALIKIFHGNDFHVEFLPPVYYFGSGYPNKTTGKIDNHKMMTFTVLGTQRSNGESLFQQDVHAFLHQKFVFATDTKISPFNDSTIAKYFTEFDCEHDAAKLIATSTIFDKFKTPTKK